MSEPIQNRYEFVLLFDVVDGNPNGDPDAGNLPRIDPETGHGLVTDVCLKRKVRNYVGLTREYQAPNDIYVKEKAVLGRAHVKAFADLGIDLGEEVTVDIPEAVHDILVEEGLADGLELRSEEEKWSLVATPGTNKKDVKDWLKEGNLQKDAKKAVNDLMKKSKARKPTAEETKRGREYMCSRFYDIRTFGAVMSLKTAPNCGQVRGPVQLTFARSVDQIVTLEHSITRMAVATEAEAEKQSGDNRTMGRKFTVSYGLYRAHGFVSAPLADPANRGTGFSQADLDLLWEALINMFDHDRSAARGQMATRRLIVFEHSSKFGSAPAHQLFDLVKVEQLPDLEGPIRGWNDYRVSIDQAALPQGVSLRELV